MGSLANNKAYLDMMAGIAETRAKEAAEIEQRMKQLEISRDGMGPNEASTTRSAILSQSGNIAVASNISVPSTNPFRQTTVADARPETEANTISPPKSIKSQEDDYWAGPFFLPHPKLNPRLSSLIVAIIDLASCINAHTRPALPLEMAASYMMPETFSTIIKLFNLQEPEFGPTTLLQKYGTAPFDRVFATYYNSFQMPIVWATRPGTGRNEELPLITRRTLHFWLRNCIAAQPSYFEKILNDILHDCVELVDPITESPFLVKVIPKTCFPIEPMAGAVEWLPGGFKNYIPAKNKIFRLARPVEEELVLARQDLANAREEARMHRRLDVQEMGGWKIDATGNRTWQEGSQW